MSPMPIILAAAEAVREIGLTQETTTSYNMKIGLRWSMRRRREKGRGGDFEGA
jgi:hypothetical protein